LDLQIKCSPRETNSFGLLSGKGHKAIKQLRFKSFWTQLQNLNVDLVPQAMLAGSLAVTPLAALSRPAAGMEDIPT
jgi:hypothetical protein